MPSEINKETSEVNEEDLELVKQSRESNDAVLEEKVKESSIPENLEDLVDSPTDQYADNPKEGIIREEIRAPEEAVLHPSPDKEFENIQKTLESLSDISTPYSQLSKLKQKRALKRANKLLKREGLKPMTHEDMLSSTSWDTIHSTDKEITMSVMTTMMTLQKIIEHEALPNEFKETESYQDLKKYFTHGVRIMHHNLKEARKLLHDKDGKPRSGDVSSLDMGPYAEAFDAYNQIRTDLVQLLGYITDPVGILLSAIKVSLEIKDKDKQTVGGESSVDEVKKASNVE